MITGESIPLEKKSGDEVIGATINKTGSFKFRATKVGKETALAQIIKLVQEAQGSKPPIARLADVIASYFVPAVIIISVITFIVWYMFGPEPSFYIRTLEFCCCPDYCLPMRIGPCNTNIRNGRHRKGRYEWHTISQRRGTGNSAQVKCCYFRQDRDAYKRRAISDGYNRGEGQGSRGIEKEILLFAASAEKGF